MIYFLRRHVDLDFALLIVCAGVVDSFILGYDAPYLAGSKPGGALLGAGLAVLMTFPFYLYLIGKYLRRGYHHMTHQF